MVKRVMTKVIGTNRNGTVYTSFGRLSSKRKYPLKIATLTEIMTVGYVTNVTKKGDGLFGDLYFFELERGGSYEIRGFVNPAFDAKISGNKVRNAKLVCFTIDPTTALPWKRLKLKQAPNYISTIVK